MLSRGEHHLPVIYLNHPERSPVQVPIVLLQENTVFLVNNAFSVEGRGRGPLLTQLLCQKGLHCKKKKRAMHTKYGVLHLSHLEHLTPNFWCVLCQIGVLSHQLQCAFPLSSVFFPTPSSVFHTTSVCFPTNFSVFSH